MADVLDVRGEEVGQCSGTVLAPELILTAGHCAEDLQNGAVNEASGYRVVTGNLNWAAPEAEKQVSGVSRVIVCSCFDRQTTVGDVALLELSTPTTAPAVTLASRQHVGAGAQALFAGWGDTYANDPIPVERLRWAPTVIQAPQRCEREASPFSPSGELCVLDPPALRTGACNGDSGGPLLVPDASAVGGMAQIGVASHVYGECATTSPSVFTRVAAVSAWIRGWLEALAPGQASAASAPDDAVPVPELAGIARAESLSVRNGTASLAITCDAEGGVCAGTAEATMTVRETLIARRGGGQTRSTHARKLTLINSSFSIAPGAGIVVLARLSRQDIALLSHLRGEPIDVELTGEGVADGVLTVTSG
jgi:secreted trypsin-like serine protease